MSALDEKEIIPFDDVDDLSIRNLRVLAVDTVENADSGHPGAPMALSPIAHILWTRFFNANPKDPKWINRDRFVLSNGHACVLQYMMLFVSGYDMTLDDLKHFRQLNSRTPGHPENILTPGIEVTTGPLGQGLAQSVGLAIAQRHLAAVYNRPNYNLFNHKIYAFCGDGCMMEGVSSEAASLAGHLQLDNLIWIYDDNKITIDGTTDITFTENVSKRFEAYGFDVHTIQNGNTDYQTMIKTLHQSQINQKKPILIILKTNIAYLSKKQDDPASHGSPLGKDIAKEYKKVMKFNPEENFKIHNEMLKRYEETFQSRGTKKYKEWNQLFNNYCNEYKNEGIKLKKLLANDFSYSDWASLLPKWEPKNYPEATRSLNHQVLNILCDKLTEIVGGSADLATSNKTGLKNVKNFEPKSYEGRHIRYGVREHGMFAINNGIAAYGANLIPFSATFLNFITYGWGAVRVGALSHLRHLYIMTHDCIWLGEDGPTHQPIEVLPLVRALPRMHTFRPADGNEINGSWIFSLNYKDGPTTMVLSRQSVTYVNNTSIDGTLKGFYVIEDNSQNNKLDAILIGTGSELSMGYEAMKLLIKEGKKIRLISGPCWELFEKQSIEYKKSIIIPNIPVISIEASSYLGWDRYSHHHIGINAQFGKSAPWKDLQKYFGFTPQQIANKVNQYIDLWKTQYNQHHVPLLPCLIQEIPDNNNDHAQH